MTKAPTPTEKSKKQCDNTKTPPKNSITQVLTCKDVCQQATISGRKIVAHSGLEPAAF